MGPFLDARGGGDQESVNWRGDWMELVMSVGGALGTAWGREGK